MKETYVLDTHIWIWMNDNPDKLKAKEQQTIIKASKNGSLILPAICIWEISILIQQEKLQLNLPLSQWVEEALNIPNLHIQQLSPEVSIESTQLPGEFHKNPADRMIVATARILNSPLITHDKRIIQYSQTGQVRTL